MPPQSLPGFRDFFPEDVALRNHIFSVWRRVAARYGFEEYDGPPLEPLDLYTAKSGEEIVDQLYAFTDKGGRQVALRPEMTPTLARMVAARAGGLKKPIRWFSMPQLFRYERHQRGRLREHFQLNMDIIGEAGPLADAELVAAAVDVMRGLGLGPEDVRLRISDRRVLAALLQARGLDHRQIEVTYIQIDKIARESREVLRANLQASAGLAAAEADAALAVGDLVGLRAVQEALGDVPGGERIGEPLATCVAALGDMGLGHFVEVDLSIVRGLAYYTGIVFELFDAQGSLRAICGGGRYDGLLGAVGGTDLPAVGFGMGDVVIGELLREHGRLPKLGPGLDAFLVNVTSGDVPAVLHLARTMRDDGLDVEFALKEQSVAKQLKLAAARNARYAVIIGPDERQVGEAVVRDLAASEERRVALDQLVKELGR